ncbi:heme oxygenase [Staphylococcus sp. SQ8-PEA]|uniref:Signal transduction protein TRAP n=1 Tax=Staphylococcus marylandisciuri TaxID=2981529 RepID=A0ABT2QM86_9STAP|nr:heme oxygenase [Staphylococcus marylandisciuri]MCU5745108.1 heme oxygenase [Staphylococcus marylandisciuri]
MFVVTNRLQVKTGYATKMAPMFTKNNGIKEMKGFIRIEVWKVQTDNDYEDLYVNTWWKSEDDFKGWVNSDAFKNAHRKSKPDSEESPVLSNEIVKADVLEQLK